MKFQLPWLVATASICSRNVFPITLRPRDFWPDHSIIAYLNLKLEFFFFCLYLIIYLCLVNLLSVFSFSFICSVKPLSVFRLSLLAVYLYLGVYCNPQPCCYVTAGYPGCYTMSWRRPCKTSCTAAGTNTTAEGGRRSSRDATRQVNNCVVWSVGNFMVF